MRFCENCNECIDHKPKPSRFCNLSCASTYNAVRAYKVYYFNCLFCGKLNSTGEKTKKFCGRSCSASLNNSIDPKRQRGGAWICPDCGNEKENSRTFRCSFCAEAFRVIKSEIARFCTMCGVEGRYNGSLCRDCTREWRRPYELAKYYDRMDRLKAEWGNKCVDCGSRENLEFDHVDPATKSFGIANRIATTAMSVIRMEAEKCVLRCKPCHILKTVREGDVMKGRLRNINAH